MKNSIKYWVETSAYDLKVAKSLYEKKHYLYVAFTCHQSVEKILKALYIKKYDSFPPKIHNLIKLSEMTNIRIKISEEQLKFIAELDPMNIEARYPSYKSNITGFLSKKETKIILLKTKGIVKWLTSQLN